MKKRVSINNKIRVGYGVSLVVMIIMGFQGISALNRSSEGLIRYAALAGESLSSGGVEAASLRQQVALERYARVESEEALRSYETEAKAFDEAVDRAKEEFKGAPEAAGVDQIEKTE